MRKITLILCALAISACTRECPDKDVHLTTKVVAVRKTNGQEIIQEREVKWHIRNDSVFECTRKGGDVYRGYPFIDGKILLESEEFMFSFE